jgi:hypothetical protein
MRGKLYGVPGSHPTKAAELMLRQRRFVSGAGVEGSVPAPPKAVGRAVMGPAYDRGAREVACDPSGC